MSPAAPCHNIAQVAMAVAGLTLLACSTPQVEVPSGLVGRWTTDDERFYGRAMVFAGQSVTFETGVEPPMTHSIVAIEEGEVAASMRALAIRYLGEGGREYLLSLTYDSAAETIHLENRREVRWTRERTP